LGKEVENRDRIVVMSRAFIRDLLAKGVTVQVISLAFGIAKSAVYNWCSRGETIPSKVHFLRLYAMSRTPDQLLPVVLVGIAYCEAHRISGSVLDLLSVSGMTDQSGQLLVAGGVATGSPVGGVERWLAGRGARAIAGKKLIARTDRMVAPPCFPAGALAAMSVNPTETWPEILKQVSKPKKR